MLKSTYKTAAVQAPSPEASLPAGWTEHKAPSGHTYYYNADTKQSTYTRPTEVTSSTLPIDYHATTPSYQNISSPSLSGSGPRQDGSYSLSNERGGRGSFRGGHSYQDRSRRQYPEDRPKSKVAIPNCEPWLLVKTKLGRRFVYNPEKGESFWKFPQDVLLAVMEMDRMEREMKEKKDKGELLVSEEIPAPPEKSSAEGQGALTSRSAEGVQEDSDSYEEVEVTDDEGEGGVAHDDDDDEQEGPFKKSRTTEGNPDSGLVEFNEDDIAYQLAQMGQDYGLDPGEYGVEEDYEDYEEGAEGLPLTEEDSTALFRDLLDDFRINPYTTWEKIIEEGHIIDDARYTVLPTTASRRQAFSDWSKERIATLKEARAKEEKKDPRVAYLRLLHDHATPKLYWVEFKRKFKNEPAVRDLYLSDKEREKLYREHIARLKLPEATRKADMEQLLQAAPLTILNHDTTLDTLPTTILANIKFISLPTQTRDALVEKHISTLPPPPMDGDEALLLSAEEAAAREKKREERQRREAALADRERRVQEEKRRQRGALRHGRELLRDEVEQLDRAVKAVGKDGLKAYMEVEEEEGGGAWRRRRACHGRISPIHGRLPRWLGDRLDPASETDHVLRGRTDVRPSTCLVQYLYLEAPPFPEPQHLPTLGRQVCTDIDFQLCATHSTVQAPPTHPPTQTCN